MAIPGSFQTFDLNVGTKLDVEDAIWLIDPFDVPLQGGMGAEGWSALANDTATEVKFEWLDEKLLTPKTTLNGAIVTATTNIVVAAGTGISFQTGDVMQIGAEQVYVSGYGTTADNLTVTRAFNSTTATGYASGATVIGVGSALPEGSDPPNARAVDRTDRYNYTQILGPTAVQVSGTEQVVQKYGLVGTEFDHQIANRTKEQAIQFEQALINGIPSAGSATVGRTTGGMAYWISTNVDSTTTTLTDATILAQVQACFDAGGRPNRFMVNFQQFVTISAINSTDIRYQQETNVRGQVIRFYDTPAGRISVVLNRWVLPSQAFLFSREQATIMTLRPFQMEMLAKTGDSTKGQVVAEKGLKFRLQTHAARFAALQ